MRELNRASVQTADEAVPAGDSGELDSGRNYSAENISDGLADFPGGEGERADADLNASHAHLLRVGRFTVSLFLFGAALILLIDGKIIDSVFSAVSLAISLIFSVAAERGQKYSLWKDKACAARICLSPYMGPSRVNALFIPLRLRLAPAGAGVLCALAVLIYGLARQSAASDVAVWIIAALSAPMLLGYGTITAVAIGNGISRLKQHDMDISNPEKLGAIAKAEFLLADKTLFFGNKGAEISGIFINGDFRGLSDIDFEGYKQLIIAFNLCDDGTLGGAYGFKRSIGESFLRALRTSPDEQRDIQKFKPARRIPYDEKTGIVSAECSGPFGSLMSFSIGRPESLLPLTKYIFTDSGTHEISPHEQKRLRIILRQKYSTGRLAAMVCSGIPGESALTFIAFVFITIPASDDASKAVLDLRDNGTDTMFVTDENEICAFSRAAALNITADMSQVLTGNRIDNFKSGSLLRAAAHAHLAAETGQSHRRILGKLLHGRKRVLIAASKNPEDTLLENAHIRITSKTDGAFPPDVCSRTCQITDVSILVRTARAVCSLAKRASYHMMFPSMCISFTLFLCAAFTGTLPFSPAVIVPSVLLLPLPQALITAASDFGADTLTYSGILPFYKTEKRSAVIRTPERSFLAWWIFSVLLTSLTAFVVFGSQSSEGGTGTPAASGAAYLTIFLAVMVNGLISFAWGRSVFSVMEQGGRKLLAATIVLAAVVIVLLRIEAFNSLIGFAVVPYRQIPSAALPAALLFVLYELMSAIRLKFEKRRKGYAAVNGM